MYRILLVTLLLIIICTGCMKKERNPDGGNNHNKVPNIEQNVTDTPDNTANGSNNNHDTDHNESTPDEFTNGQHNAPDDKNDDPEPPADKDPWEGIDVEMPYTIEVFLDQLEVPWAIDFAEDGRIFFTERPGRIRVYENGELLAEPMITFPDTYHRSEGGLLGLVLHPDFAHNQYMYVYQTYLNNGSPKNRVLRLKADGNTASIDQVIIDDLPGANNHNGGRIRIGTDNKLYITAGEIYQTHLAQQLNNLGGKILRLNLDGTIPSDNPFEDSPIYSWGHRNPQGLAWHPETNHLFSSEHGQSAHDEINIIYAGENYGWPIIEGDQQAEGMISPLVHSGTETWAPSGATFITQGPWNNQLLVANLRGEKIIRFELDYDDEQFQVSRIVYLFEQEYGRIRDVYEHADGTIYFLTNNHDGRGKPTKTDDRIMVLKPLF